MEISGRIKIRHCVVLMSFVFAVYTTVVIVSDTAKGWDWSNQLAASVISFAFAVLAGFVLYRNQRELDDASGRARFRLLLQVELSDMRRAIADKRANEINLPSGKRLRIVATFIQPLVVERAVLSGLFEMVDSENLLLFARKVRVYTNNVEVLRSVYNVSAEDELIQLAVVNVEATRKALIKDIDFIFRSMGLEQSSSHLTG
ncbi:hypothetical protein [Lysobacter capsici]|uniref:hypothetical protein n=1 Tax=Lysobacter capsici TaxID=435897 RepID=UPI00128FE701|nr:hypothetical protein [Lysobacter capsici]